MTKLGTSSQPSTVRVGPNNTIWFTDRGTNAIGKLSATAPPGSTVTMINTPQSGTPPQSSTPAQMSAYDSTSGKFWFGEFNSASGVNDIVSMVSSTNKMTPVDLKLTSDQIPNSIVVSPDGAAVWVNVASTAGNNAIYRYSPATGKYWNFSLSTSDQTRRFAFDASGNLWMSERTNSDVVEFGYDQKTGKIVQKHVVKLQANNRNTQPTDIVLGPDGNLWVADYSNVIYRVMPGSLSYTSFPMSGVAGCLGSGATSIANGLPGSNVLWFSDYRCNAIGQITTSGVVTEYQSSATNPDPTKPPHPNSVALAPDGSIWYSDQSINQLVRFKP